MSYKNYLNNPSATSIFFSPTTASEVSKIISNLSESKSNGPESIHTGILKQISPIISQTLSKIINLCYTSGVYPQCLKSAIIVPIHKKDSKLLVTNYRPISLLSNIYQ